MSIEEKTQSVHTYSSLTLHYITLTLHHLLGERHLGVDCVVGGGGGQMGSVNCPISDPFCFSLERQYPITLTSQ